MSRVKLHREDGVDVSRLTGIGATEAEQHFYDLYVGHFERCKAEPKVSNFRLCVEAYDNLVAEIRKR